ncbi:hypothetical protein [Ereboglobus luteus]|uniref:Peptidase S9 prolyl oligopeptidase catalytic domain-containing protein n=1 Tax=Ereboglobus luteus TaxID=1796921 RepID=A0A2U8E0G1_9BACT|nr:hypothetical protein [Ereboglobus luteus]AWI08320.1 hypothetical protein CKA38_02765 [Ereboglobus luteus]
MERAYRRKHQPDIIKMIMRNMFLLKFCAGIFMICSVCCTKANAEYDYAIPKDEIPAFALKDESRDIKKYMSLGAWSAPGSADWKNTVRVTLDYNLIQVEAKGKPLEDTAKKLISLVEDMRASVPSRESPQTSMIAFAGISERPKTMIFEINTNARVALYNNGVLVKELPEDNLGAYDKTVNLYIPVPLEKGENIIVIKTLSNGAPSALRITATPDLGRELQTALDANKGLLSKKVTRQNDPPRLKWPSALSRLCVTIDVVDAMNEKPVFSKTNMRNGYAIRNTTSNLANGLYRITYKAAGESFEEYFLIGPPRALFASIKKRIGELNITNDDIKLNVDAQVARGEILFDQANYDPDGDEWQGKVVYTLGALASMSNTLKNNQQDILHGAPGLHIKGFISSVDKSIQHYRLYVPSNYNPDQALPLMVIIPTPVAAKGKPFIESPFIAAHQNAVLISRVAEKHGFAVLWPGYKSSLMGWTYESAHIDEALRAVEKDYVIDKTRTSVYGSCGAGFFAGRLVSIYPQRFAAIVFNKGIFTRKLSTQDDSGPIRMWLEATNPDKHIIDNKQMKVLLIHDGSRRMGHGEIELSKAFLEKAKGKDASIEARLNQPLYGEPDWNMIFSWLKSCRNANASERPSEFLKTAGFEGPVSEIFATPVIIVRGTGASAGYITSMVEHIKTTYAKQFYGAEPIVKNDHEVTDHEMNNYSLVLVGNPQSNHVWHKLQKDIPITTTAFDLFIGSHTFDKKSAFVSIFTHPKNANKFILTIGAYDLKNLALAKKADLYNAWFDAQIFEPRGRGRIIPKLNLAGN